MERENNDLIKKNELYVLKLNNLQNDLNVAVQINKDNVKLIETLTIKEKNTKKIIEDYSILRQLDDKKYNHLIEKTNTDDGKKQASITILNTIKEISP